MYYAYESSLFSCLDWLILPGSHLSRHNMQWGGSNPSCLQRDQKQCACAVCYQLFNLVPRGPFCHAQRILDPRRWPKRSRLLGTRLPAVPLLARFTGLVKLKNSRNPAINRAGSVAMCLQSCFLLLLMKVQKSRQASQSGSCYVTILLHDIPFIDIFPI